MFRDKSARNFLHASKIQNISNFENNYVTLHNKVLQILFYTFFTCVKIHFIFFEFKRQNDKESYKALD